MEPIHYGIIGMVALAVLIVLGVRIFVAAGIVGFCGLWALRGFDKAVGISGHIPIPTPPTTRSRSCRSSS